MSLFENSEFQWRETYFIMFDGERRPSIAQIQSIIDGMGGRLKADEIRAADDGSFESVTLYAPDDFSAMDIVCTAGDEVIEQLPSLVEELEPNIIDEDEQAQLALVKRSTARLEVFHFEQHTFINMEGEEPNMMDPGGVLIVLERLSGLCDGVVVDPQSASVM